MELISKDFWDCICVDTHLPRFEALVYVLPHSDALTHVVIRVLGVHLSKFTEVCFSVFVKRSSFESLLNLRTHFKSLLKVYYRSMFAESSRAFIFQKLQRPLCHKVNLPSCVARRPLCHKANLPSCIARGPLCPRVNSTEMWSSAEPFHHDLWYFQHRTNEHFRSTLLFGETHKQRTVPPVKSLKSTHSPKLLHLACWDKPYDITSLQDFFIMIHSLNRGFAVRNPYVQNNCHDQINLSQ